MIFLKAKHWQLFILMFGLPFLAQMVMMSIFFTKIFAQTQAGVQPDPTVMFSYMKFMPFIMLLFMGVFYGWFWSVTTGLQKFIPDEAKMKLLRFKIFLIFPVVYIFCIIFFVSTMISNMEAGTPPNPALFAVIFPLHFFSMFCMFHSLFFVAKAVKTAELQRETSFSEFVGEFFLIWFYPIGVWFIQPKLNKIVSGTLSQEEAEVNLLDSAFSE